MKTAIDRALEWFDIEKYRRLDNCTDVGLFAFLLERFEVHDEIERRSNSVNGDGAVAVSLNDDPAYERIFRLDPENYFVSPEDFYGEVQSLTPHWLEEVGHSCVAVRPLSVADIACANDDLLDGVPVDWEKDVFDCAMEMAVEMNRRSIDDEEQGYLSREIQELDYISYDQYLLESFGHHTGDACLQIDLSADDDQILNELKSLLPLLRGKLKKRNEPRYLSSTGQSFAGPLSGKRKRKTDKIDPYDARRWRVPALMDLYLWSRVEGLALSKGDYYRLVFPGNDDSDFEVKDSSAVGGKCFKCMLNCLDKTRLSALGRELKADFLHSVHRK